MFAISLPARTDKKDGNATLCSIDGVEVPFDKSLGMPYTGRSGSAYTDCLAADPSRFNEHCMKGPIDLDSEAEAFYAEAGDESKKTLGFRERASSMNSEAMVKG